MSLIALMLIALVHLYQAVLSPIMGGHCRFHPTCSNYALEALRHHGAVRGSWLTLRRLLRCHPFTRGGIDAVPMRVETEDERDRLRCISKLPSRWH